jgi:hypothetical protein
MDDPSSNEFGIVSKESNSSFPSTIAYESQVVYDGSGVLDSFGFAISDGSTTNNVSYNTGSSLKDSVWQPHCGDVGRCRRRTQTLF